MMICNRPFTLSVLLYLAILTANVASFMTDTDQDMKDKADMDQINRHLQQVEGWHKVASNIPFPTGSQFHDHVLRLAEGGSAYVGTHREDLGSSFYAMRPPKRQTERPATTYFYSLIQPEDKPGRMLELPSNTLANVFWKHHAGLGRSEILSIDVIYRKPKVEWDLDLLSNILKRH